MLLKASKSRLSKDTVEIKLRISTRLPGPCCPDQRQLWKPGSCRLITQEVHPPSLLPVVGAVTYPWIPAELSPCWRCGQSNPCSLMRSTGGMAAPGSEPRCFPEPLSCWLSCVCAQAPQSDPATLLCPGVLQTVPFPAPCLTGNPSGHAIIY